MGKPRHRGDVVQSQNTSSPGSPQGWQQAQGAGFAGIRNRSSSRSRQGAIPSPAPPEQSQPSPPGSQLLFKGAFLGTLPRERALGRKRWELLPSGCRQTAGTGSTFCNSSKIRCTSQPVRSRTRHPAGSGPGQGIRGHFHQRGAQTPRVGCSRGWGCSAPRNSAQRENLDGRGTCVPAPNISHRQGPHHAGYPNGSMAKPKHPRISLDKPLPAQAKGS